MAKRDLPQSLTDLPAAPGEDRRDRAIKYVIAMGARTLCVIACIIARDNWILVLIFGIGAVALPYFAVVVANVGAKPARQAAVVRPVEVVPVLEPRREPSSGQ